MAFNNYNKTARYTKREKSKLDRFLKSIRTRLRFGRSFGVIRLEI
jgi:hypothetical protein